MADLFTPALVGDVRVQNRIFMAPLTRNRADNDTDNPSCLAAEYYSQRASAGLIISEATQISPWGKGYISTPGIYNEDHVKHWRKIVSAVHEEEGKIFLQLWHVGRISHSSVLPDHGQPLAPSAIQADATTFTDEGRTSVSAPREMTIDDIQQTIEDYQKAAAFAKQAGFDGVEIHAANGYLINQFLCDKTNHRNDIYGRSVLGRYRFLQEVLHAVLSEWPGGRVGVRLSPVGTFNDISDSNPADTFGYVIDELNKLNLAYLHFVERFPGIELNNQDQKILMQLRQKWDGFYIGNGEYDFASGLDAVKSGRADAVAYGRSFIANPDLPKRFELGATLNAPDQDTFYGGGKEGYIDYPFLNQKDKDNHQAAE